PDSSCRLRGIGPALRAKAYLVFAGAVPAQEVQPALDLATQRPLEEAAFRRADLGEALRHLADGAVVLGERAAAEGGVTFRHVSLFLPRAGDDAHPLRGGGAGQLRREPGLQLFIAGHQERHRRLPPLPRHEVIQQLPQGFLVALRKERFPGGGQPIGKAGRTHGTALHPLIDHQPGCLQLLEVVPDGVEREPDLDPELLDREPARALELEQHLAPRAPVSGGQALDAGRLVQGARHGRNPKCSGRDCQTFWGNLVRIPKSFTPNQLAPRWPPVDRPLEPAPNPGPTPHLPSFRPSVFPSQVVFKTTTTPSLV